MNAVVIPITAARKPEERTELKAACIEAFGNLGISNLTVFDRMLFERAFRAGAAWRESQATPSRPTC